MKKLNLNLAGSIRSLTKEQMKKINGGYGPACGLNCYYSGICNNATDGCISCEVHSIGIAYCVGGGGGPWCSASNCGPECPNFNCGCVIATC